MKKIFTFAAVAMMAFASQANVLTVCDGTDKSNYVPMFGYMYDTELTTSQMIYPAEMLTDMVGATITQVKFYSEQLKFYNGQMALGMQSNAKDNFDDETLVLTSMNALTVPVEGAQELVFDLSEPFVYEGGNLLIDAYVYEEGHWGTTYFYGVNVDFKASICSYDYWGESVYNLYTFLPKVTFTYEAGEAPVYDETCAAPNGQYVIIDKEKALVTITNNEPDATVHYVVTLDGELVEEGDFTGETWEYVAVGAGDWRISCVASMPGKNDSQPGGVFFPIEPGQTPVSVDEMMAGKTVSSVRYFNVAGQEMQEANGMTIVVTTYTDGTNSAVKVVK